MSVEHIEFVVEEPSMEAFLSGLLPQIEAARAISLHLDPVRNKSRSFAVFRDAVLEMVTR